MKGTFTTKEQLMGFISPLKNFAAIMGENGIVINFENKDGVVSASISAINQSAGTVIKSAYKSLFDGFTMTNDTCQIGILKLQDFVGLFSLVDDANIDIEFDETTKDFKITQGKASVVYQTADPDLISQFKKPFNGTNWYCSIVYDNKFDKFTKAMSVLSSEECVIVKGDSAKSNLSIAVKNRAVAINSYNVDVDAEVSDNFDIAYKKEHLQSILSTRHEATKLTFGERVVMIEVSDKFNDTVFYVAKMVK